MRISDWSSDVCSSDLTNSDTSANAPAIRIYLRPSGWTSGKRHFTVVVVIGGLSSGDMAHGLAVRRPQHNRLRRRRRAEVDRPPPSAYRLGPHPYTPTDSEKQWRRTVDRRVGQEGVQQGSSRWSPCTKTNN